MSCGRQVLQTAGLAVSQEMFIAGICAPAGGVKKGQKVCGTKGFEEPDSLIFIRRQDHETESS